MATEHGTKESERLPSSVTEFIGRVLKKMRYRRKVRAEVETELVGHFADELRDCNEQEQKMKKAKQLVAEFGDVRILGVLLRRAKKRCRPLWRTAIARSLQAAGLLILCFLIYIAWFFSGKPAITTDYVAKLNNSIEPAADESLNAAPLYDNAIGLADNLSDEFLLYFAQNHQVIAYTEKEAYVKGLSELAERVHETLSSAQDGEPPEYDPSIRHSVYGMVSTHLARARLSSGGLTPDQMSFVERWVAEHNDALELVVEGSRMPHCWREYKSRQKSDGWMMGVHIPNLSELRELGRILGMRALVSADHGRHEEAFDDVIALYRFARHIRTGKFMVEQVVGIAGEALAVQTARRVVGSYEVSPKVLERFQHHFERIVADEDFSICLEAEKLSTYDEIQRSFTSGGPGQGHLYPPRFEELFCTVNTYRPNSSLESFMLNAGQYRQYLPIFGHPNRQETLDTAHAIYEYYDQLQSKTAVQRHAERASIDRKLTGLLKSNPFLQHFSPNMVYTLERANRLPTEVAATLAVAAASRYKADKGNYPQDLTQLVAESYLREMPIDTFSDKPLVYRKSGDDFVLYSVGRNFTDDGGKPGTDTSGQPRHWIGSGDTVFWPLPKP